MLILHNVPRLHDDPTHSVFSESDVGVMEQVEAVSGALETLKVPCRVMGVRRLSDLPAVLSAAPETVVFNLVEGLIGHWADVNIVPAVCRAFGKGCTGGDTACLILALDKWVSKANMIAHGLPVPFGVVVPIGGKIPVKQLPAGKVIVKPSSTDASEGIDSASVTDSRNGNLESLVLRVHEQFNQPALVEQFVDGRELNVSVLQRDGKPEVLAIAEIDFSAFPPEKPRIVDYAAKWLCDTFEYQNTPRILPAPLEPAQAKKVRQLSLAAWHALGCQDYTRVDFRLDREGVAYIMEVNPNPDISPEGGFWAALKAAKVPYHEFVRTVVTNAQSRIP